MKFTEKEIIATCGNLALVTAFFTAPMAVYVYIETSQIGSSIIGFTPFVLFIMSIILRKHAEEPPLSPIAGILFIGFISFLAYAA